MNEGWFWNAIHWVRRINTNTEQGVCDPVRLGDGASPSFFLILTPPRPHLGFYLWTKSPSTLTSPLISIPWICDETWHFPAWLCSFSREYIFGRIHKNRRWNFCKERGRFFLGTVGMNGCPSLGAFPEAGFLSGLNFPCWQRPGVLPSMATFFFFFLLTCPQPANVIWRSMKNCIRHVS